jgi:hypothetical protein
MPDTALATRPGYNLRAVHDRDPSDNREGKARPSRIVRAAPTS